MTPTVILRYLALAWALTIALALGAPTLAPAEPPSGVKIVSRSATVVTGGTAVSIAATLGRKGGWVMNPCDATESLFISLGGTAVTTSGAPNHADLPACGRVNLGGAAGVYQGAISINAATSGHKFEAVELE